MLNGKIFIKNLGKIGKIVDLKFVIKIIVKIIA
jgi:hypothetical protein